ncbi:MAG: methyltransferase [Sulfolobales archaeon]
MEVYRCPNPEEQIYRPSDDTYLLTETLLGSQEDLRRSRIILDLGTGSGYIAQQLCLELMKKDTFHEIVAIDISPCSIEYMRKHLSRECVDHVSLMQCDGATCLREESIDLVAINPPYLPVNERSTWLEITWSGGERGVDRAIEMVKSVLKPLSRQGFIYIVLSSLGDLGLFEDSMRAEGLTYRIIARKKLFFEELVVYKLKRNSELF